MTSTAAGAYLQDVVANPAQYDNATLTASVYLCVPSGTPSINLHIYNQNPSGITAIATQSVALSSTWQRFSLTGTAANGLMKLYLQIGDSTSFPSGETVYVWGAQMVMGSSAGAPIQTVNTTTSDASGATVYLAANGMNESYNYDAFGNMVSSGNFTFQQAYTTANQLVGWSYDASGNLLTDAFNKPYTYDAESRISAYAGNNYVYDADGNRVEKNGSVATDYIYFGGRQLARLSAGQWTDLIYGPTGLLAEVPGTQTGAPIYRMLDQLGTQVGTLSSTGVQLSSTDYAPFGQLFAGGTTDPYQFTGKERDSESGNDYFGARYYASSMGRFMSPDWSAKIEPVPYSKLDDPQSLNLYAYVTNNPLTRRDIDGHCAVGGGGSFIEQAEMCGHFVWASAPTLLNGQPAPPNIPVPGAPAGTKWKWNPNPKNSRGGSWGPEKWNGKTQGSAPSASWDDKPGKNGVEHWDVDDGKGNRTRVDEDGNPLTPGQAHGTATPTPGQASPGSNQSPMDKINDWLNEHLPEGLKQYLRDHPYGPNSSPGPYVPPLVPTPIPLPI